MSSIALKTGGAVFYNFASYYLLLCISSTLLPTYYHKALEVRGEQVPIPALG